MDCRQTRSNVGIPAAKVSTFMVPSWWEMMFLCRDADRDHTPPPPPPKRLKKTIPSQVGGAFEMLPRWGERLLPTGLPLNALLIHQSATHQCATNQSCAYGSSFGNLRHAARWKMWRLLSSAGASF